MPALANWDKLSFRFPLYLEDLTGNVKVIAFSPDGKQVLTSSDDKTARLWETNSGKLLSTLENDIGTGDIVAFSPDGNYAITGDENGLVLWWSSGEANEGKLLGLYVTAYEIGAISWKDVKHVVLADMGGPQGRPHFYQLQLEGEW